MKINQASQRVRKRWKKARQREGYDYYFANKKNVFSASYIPDTMLGTRDIDTDWGGGTVHLCMLGGH